MGKESLSGKVAQFFNSKGETPQQFLNSEGETWTLEDPNIEPWWKPNNAPQYWKNTELEQEEHKD